MRILVIDTSALLHAAKHSVGKAKLSSNEQYTFVIFGFLFRLRNLVQKTYADRIVFAYDSDSSLRKELIYSEYKSNRNDSNKTEKEKELDAIARPQFAVVKKIIKYIGYKNTFEVKGFEADDIIASVVKSHKNDEVVVCTSDKDMYQLISPTCMMIKPKDYRWYGLKEFRQEYGIEPLMWKRVKVYGGCSTDSVPGLPIPSEDKTKKIRHIGEGLALSYIKNKINPQSNTYKAFFGPTAKKIVSRNKSLVILPFKGTPEFTLQVDDNLSKERFLQVCREYNFSSILSDIADFSHVLKLK